MPVVATLAQPVLVAEAHAQPVPPASPERTLAVVPPLIIVPRGGNGGSGRLQKARVGVACLLVLALGFASAAAIAKPFWKHGDESTSTPRGDSIGQPSDPSGTTPVPIADAVSTASDIDAISAVSDTDTTTNRHWWRHRWTTHTSTTPVTGSAIRSTTIAAATTIPTGTDTATTTTGTATTPTGTDMTGTATTPTGTATTPTGTDMTPTGTDTSPTNTDIARTGTGTPPAGTDTTPTTVDTTSRGTDTTHTGTDTTTTATEATPTATETTPADTHTDTKTTTTPTTTTPTTTTPTTTTPTTTTPTTTTPTAGTSASVTPQPVGIPGNWTMVLDSEFDTTTLNTSIWRPGWWGSEVTDPVNVLEDDCYNADNVALSGTALDLSVTNQSSSCDGVTYPYTGALVSSNPEDGRGSGGFDYTYGVLEARVYIPASGNGEIANWPAVWATSLANETYDEDDLMEGLGGEAAWHFHNSKSAIGESVPSIRPGWHTFASNWQPGSITYYYDGIEVGSVATGTVDEPMYIILDDTVSAISLNLESASTMQVQYVRVWQQS